MLFDVSNGTRTSARIKLIPEGEVSDNTALRSAPAGEAWIALDSDSRSSSIAEERRYIETRCMAIERMPLLPMASKLVAVVVGLAGAEHEARHCLLLKLMTVQSNILALRLQSTRNSIQPRAIDGRHNLNQTALAELGEEHLERPSQAKDHIVDALSLDGTRF